MSANIWLFTGPELGEKNTQINSLKKKLIRDLGSLDCHTLYSHETGVFEVINTLQSGSLFEAGTLVVLRGCELIKKKEEIDALNSWASGNNSSSFLIMVSDEIKIDKRIEKIIPQTQKQIFWEMFESKKQNWIKNFFKNENISITAEAISGILELVENNTEALKTYCSHLALFFKSGTEITEDDIERLLAHNKEETAFSLFDTITCNDAELAFDILNKLLLSKNSSPIQIISGLSYCFRRLQDFHNAQANASHPLSETDLKRLGFVGKKSIAQYQRAGKFWSLDETQKIISLLSETDLKLRSLGTGLQKTILEMSIYKIVSKNIAVKEYEFF
ncbi:MAG: DNA polymerase III subunit delta [Treponema sp.]|nr:MAG: DNA polymerase III subunit delta [Treponema sp.]